MVKNFSVDWLAQSYHDSGIKQGPLDTTQALARPHVPCSVQPRPPTSYNKVYPQRVTKSIRSEQHTSTEEAKEDTALFTSLSPRICSSPNENSGYSSGYESEATGSECPSIEDDSDGPREHGIQRRTRTKFTPEQIDKLEKIFSKHKYLDAGERVKTAQKLNLSETQVRTWFQNRRMKLKREVQEMRTDYLVPGLPAMILPPVSAVQYHCFRRQRPSMPPVPEVHVFPPGPLQQSVPHHMISPPNHLMFTMQYYY
ncbi:homeobox protein vent1-like [Brachyhypopomus gauderio]|uniref:homeobox protein vent1-like n=1 Tax=Brachyhypopomus gauderio TaxID=698409 RepID=UPI0040428C32